MKRILLLKGQMFKYEQNVFELSDLYSTDMYKYLNRIVGQFYSGKSFDNIIYSKYTQNIYAIVYFLEKHHITEIKIDSSDKILTNYLLDAAKICRVNINYPKSFLSFNKVRRYLVEVFGIIISGLYLLIIQILQKRKNRTFDLNKDLCVIRTAQTKKKIHPAGNREILEEDSIGRGRLYTFIMRRRRVWMTILAIKDGFKLVSDLRHYLKKNNFTHVSYDCMKFFSIRVVHISLYERLLDYLMSFDWKGNFITGNNLDSYALVEEKVAHKHGMHIICIPHGLEYGFKFPHGFIGDIFYATSEHAAKYLNEMYKTTKFRFDIKIAEEMYKVKSNNERKGRRVVYFSEPREPNVNVLIITELLKHLEGKGITLYIKHHPKDNISDYKIFGERLHDISDLNEAITGNVCVSRKSTTLLESIYNNSVSAAILTCEKDKAIFYMFPSLQDENISVFESFRDLNDWIDMQLNLNLEEK